MPSSSQAQRIRYRIAAEALLIAEEKWILESLKKIKTQRNCLQIERLQLESMKAKLKTSERGSCAGETILPTAIGETAPSCSNEPTPSTSTVNLIQNQEKVTSSQMIEVETNMFDVEAFCNEQTLNLEVTNPVFRNNLNVNYNMEENEEEEEEFDDDVPIDMDMLMSGADME